MTASSTTFFVNNRIRAILSAGEQGLVFVATLAVQVVPMMIFAVDKS